MTTPRTLILFAHHDPHDIVDPHVRYYLEALHGLGTAIVFVSDSALAPESVASIRPFCCAVRCHRSDSFDFGSWHLGWRVAKERWSLEDFDRVALVNDSIYGPLFPIREMWDSFHGADMYGAIESDCPASGEDDGQAASQLPHLQSFFLVFDLNPRTRTLLDAYWTDFEASCHALTSAADKSPLIDRYEIGLSNRARGAGLRIKPFVSVPAIKDAYARSPAQGWRDQQAAGPINGSFYFWDILVEDLRFPFLKVKLVRHSGGGWPPWRGLARTWEESVEHVCGFIDEHTVYPSALIRSHAHRLGSTPNI